MMLARHAKPIEMSSPVGVESPLWQAEKRSRGWEKCALDFCTRSALRAIAGTRSRSVIGRLKACTKRSIRILLRLFPALAQAAVKPVPEEVKHNLGAPFDGVVHGNSHPNAGQDMLPPAE